MKKRKFADGGETTEMMPSAKPEGGRFDEDTYSRARRFVESGGKKEETKTAVKRARKVETDPTAGEAKDKAAQRAADMMDGSESTPSKNSYKDTSSRFPSKYEEPSVSRAGNRGSQAGPTVERAAKMARDKAAEDEMMRPGRDAIEGVYPESLLLGGAGALRGAVGALTSRMAAKKSAQDAVEASKAFSAPRAPEVAKSAEKYTPKQQMEAAESAMRGAANRAKIAGKRAEEKELPNEVLEILRRPRSSKIADTLGGGGATKTRGEEALEKIFNKRDADFKRGGKVKKYASGGVVSSASSRGDGIAQRGKTKGRVC